MAEINHYGDTILPVVTQEDIVEGRMVHLTANVHSRNFGSQTDLPGVLKPDTRALAATARYILFWEQDKRSLPIYQPQPHFDWALRYGFDQAANAPFNPTLVYLTHPQQQECLTIPSGEGALAFGEGIYTVASGCYTYSANVEVPGTQLEVSNDADDGAGAAGKLKELGSGTAVAEVYRFNTDNSKLTFKILH
jgi:hypothetical protein